MDLQVLSVEDELVSVWKNVKTLYERFVRKSGDNCDIFDKYKIGFTQQDLREQIRVINEKLQYRKTVCTIFEKNQDEAMLIDGILKEKISKDKNSLYIFIEDGLNQNISKMDMLESIKFITRPQSLSPILKTSIIVLCQKGFAEYFDDENRKRLPDPDLVILVINSPKDLEQDEIRSFLCSIGQKYNEGNFILVLNNAKGEECIKIRKCQDCYPASTRRCIEEIGLSVKKQIFKVSSELQLGKRKFRRGIKFKVLQKSIEASLNSSTIEKRYKKRIGQLKASLTQIAQTINVEMYKTSMSPEPNQRTLSRNSSKNSISDTSLPTESSFEQLVSKDWNNRSNTAKLESLKRNSEQALRLSKNYKIARASGNKRKNRVDARDAIIQCTIMEGVSKIVENTVEKITNFKQFIDDRLMSCGEFLDTIDINRWKINFKEKVIVGIAVMENEIKQKLKKTKKVIYKKENKNIFPNYLGHFILTLIRSTNVTLDMDKFEMQIENAISMKTQFSQMKGKLNLLLKKIHKTKFHVKICQEKLTIFIGTLNEDIFYEEEQNIRRIKKESVLKKYEELSDFMMNQVVVIKRCVSDLIAPFELS